MNDPEPEVSRHKTRKRFLVRNINSIIGLLIVFFVGVVVPAFTLCVISRYDIDSSHIIEANRRGGIGTLAVPISVLQLSLAVMLVLGVTLFALRARETFRSRQIVHTQRVKTLKNKQGEKS